MVDTSADWVIVGRFGRPHGLKGFVTVHSFTQPFDNILDYADWHMSIKGSWKPVKVLVAEMRNKTIIVQVEGYAERDLAATLTNADIAVPKSELASLEPGEFYWHQLIGMTVVNQKGQLFGTVSDLLATGSNDVLIVEGEKRHLIPYLPGQYVLEIDEAKRQITVDWDMDF